jgi:hypothetical protein
MKITSINIKESGDFTIAFNTDPPLTRPVYERYEMLHALEPALKNFKPFNMHGMTYLVLGFSNDIALPHNLAEIVERILTMAESEIVDERAQKREQENLQSRQRRERIEQTAKTLGLPLK